MPILWIDIETIPGEEKPSREEIEAPANYKDAIKIAAYQEANQDKAWREQSLHSIAGRVCCIAWAEGNAPAVCRGIWDKPEYEILADLEHVAQRLASDSGGVTWGGFNLTSFDLNWIWQRAIKYGYPALSDFISRDRYPKNVLDVRDLWTGGDTRGKGKMKDIARFLGVPCSDMDGSDVFDLYLAGEFEKISEYCRDDVATARGIAHKMGVGSPL